MSAFLHFQHTLNRLFNNFIKLYCYYISQINPSPKEKTTLKKSSLIRVKIFAFSKKFYLFNWVLISKKMNLWWIYSAYNFNYLSKCLAGKEFWLSYSLAEVTLLQVTFQIFALNGWSFCNTSIGGIVYYFLILSQITQFLDDRRRELYENIFHLRKQQIYSNYVASSKNLQF